MPVRPVETTRRQSRTMATGAEAQPLVLAGARRPGCGSRGDRRRRGCARRPRPPAGHHPERPNGNAGKQAGHGAHAEGTTGARYAELSSVTTRASTGLAVSYQARGKLHFIQSAYQPALADFGGALKQEPQLITAHFYHGLTLLALGRCSEGSAELSAPQMKPFQTPAAGTIPSVPRGASRGRRQGRLSAGDALVT